MSDDTSTIRIIESDQEQVVSVTADVRTTLQGRQQPRRFSGCDRAQAFDGRVPQGGV